MEIDYRYCKWSFSTLVAAMVICVLAVFSSFTYLNGKQQSLHSQRNELDQLRQKHDSYLTSQQLYTEYADEYLQYVNQGTLAEEDRLSWIEALKQAHAQLKPKNLNYRVTPRIRREKKHLPRSLQMFSSGMHIEMQALHSGDLNTLLQHLHTQGKGNMHVAECRIQRLEKDVPEMDVDSAKLEFHCELVWTTIHIRPQHAVDS